MGILSELFSGSWVNPDTGQPITMPIKRLVIKKSLVGDEGALVAAVHGSEASKCVVSDQITWEIYGQRIHEALEGAKTAPLILDRPKADQETVEQVRNATAKATVLIAVGSGTVTDLVKHASYTSKRDFSVFPSSPMNAYTTNSSSIVVAGSKLSLPSHGAKGVFFDLDILAGCPRRLLTSALGDVCCRSSAQIDWMLSRDFCGTAYSEVPYHLLAEDETTLMTVAGKLVTGDQDALAVLVRTCVLNGIGSLVVGTTHPGSMAEHSLSHFLDMNAGSRHPGSLHGEQIGVTTLTIMRLQEKLLGATTAPFLKPSEDCASTLIKRYGASRGGQYAAVAEAKALSAEQAERWNNEWAGDGWLRFTEQYRKSMMPAADVEAALTSAGAAISATELGFDPEFYRTAVRDARHLRNRFSILDLAAATEQFDDYLSTLAL